MSASLAGDEVEHRFIKHATTSISDNDENSAHGQLIDKNKIVTFLMFCQSFERRTKSQKAIIFYSFDFDGVSTHKKKKVRLSSQKICTNFRFKLFSTLSRVHFDAKDLSNVCVSFHV